MLHKCVLIFDELDLFNKNKKTIRLLSFLIFKSHLFMKRFRKLSKSWILSFHGFHWKSRLRMLIVIISNILFYCRLSSSFFSAVWWESLQVNESACRLLLLLFLHIVTFCSCMECLCLYAFMCVCLHAHMYEYKRERW